MKQAISSEEPSQRKALLEAADILVNELMLLEDHNFYITRYNKGRQLLMQGLNYISGDSTDIFHDADYIPASVSEEMSRIKISRATTQLTTLLKNIVTLLPTTGNEDITHYLNSVVDWEVGLYQRQMENVSEPDLQVETEAVITQQGFQ
ncbi:MAG: hypothetical protein WDA24_12490, partial [Tissierellales bacterium]